MNRYLLRYVFIKPLYLRTRPLIASLFILLFISCDPVAEMEANIQNRTTQSLRFIFDTQDTFYYKNLNIEPDSIELFEAIFDVGNTYLEPYLIVYDSVYIQDQSGNILKVYKPEDTGKNIYDIQGYWSSEEPCRRCFKYKFEIETSDIE